MLIGLEGSYVGFLGPPGELEPFQCVEFYVDGRQRAFTKTSVTGAFFTAFAIEDREYETPIEMRIDGTRYTVSTGGPSRGSITYEPDTIPLQETDEGRRAHVRVSVDGRRTSRVYTVNESRGIVESPAPRQFLGGSSTMTGVWGELGTVVTEHSNGTGGCWWPEGGGQIIRCSDAQWALNRCAVGGGAGTCERGRGCSVIQVEERHSGIGRHRSGSIPVGEPQAPEPPPDAGAMPDGGRIDAQLM